MNSLRRTIGAQAARVAGTAAHSVAWPLRLQTLGRLAVSVDGRALSIAGSARNEPLQLLCAIVSQGRHGASYDWLMSALWPQTDADTAVRSLEQSLLELRYLLRHQGIVLPLDHAVRLDSARVWADCWEFERCSAELDGALPSDLAWLFEELLNAYPGHFLPEAQAGWAVAVRGAKVERLQRSLQLALQRMQGATDPARYVQLCQRAQQALPSHESLFEGLTRLVTGSFAHYLHDIPHRAKAREVSGGQSAWGRVIG